MKNKPQRYRITFRFNLSHGGVSDIRRYRVTTTKSPVPYVRYVSNYGFVRTVVKGYRMYIPGHRLLDAVVEKI